MLSNIASRLEDRLDSLEGSVDKTIYPVIDKLSTRCESLESHVKFLNEDISSVSRNAQEVAYKLFAENELVKKQLSDFIEQADANLAIAIQESSTAQARFVSMQDDITKLFTLYDELEQYGRRDIDVFKDVPYQHGNKKLEDTTEHIINLVKKYLGVNITRHDISVCHRQHIPGAGKRSLPPIYCKFVNRCLARKIVARGHCFRFKENPAIRKITVEENLTFKRRNVYENAVAQLKNYKFKWIKNGSIYVRKTAKSKALRVNTQPALDLLVANEAAVSTTSNLPAAEGQCPQGPSSASTPPAVSSTPPAVSSTPPAVVNAGYSFYAPISRLSAFSSLSCVAFPPLLQSNYSHMSKSVAKCNVNRHIENDGVVVS